MTPVSDPLRSGFVDLDWGQVHVRGSLTGNKQPLLLLHQNPLSTVTYEKVLAPLATRFRPVAVDTPGFGRSDAPGGPWTIEEYAGILREVAARLDMGRSVIVGQHTGACLAIEMALQAPRDVAGLVLVGVPNVSPEVARDRLDAKQPYEVAADGSHLAFLWHRMTQVQYPDQLPADLATRHVADHLLAGPDSYLAGYRAVYTYPIRDRLADLAASTTPTLLLAGEHDCIKAIHDSTCDLLPDSRNVTLPRLSDFIMDEEPAEFVRQVTAFVDDHQLTGSAGGEPSPVYTATVSVEGGRAGMAASETGSLRASLARPAERGTDAGTDPEELFAAGFAACFDSSLAAGARREHVRIGPTRTRASITLQATANQRYSITASLHVDAPESTSVDLARVIELAKHSCPYAKAVHGNLDVVVTGTSAEGEL